MTTSILRLLSFVFILGAIFSPAEAQAPPSQEPVALQPGDLVRVVIWREEDLSGEFPVDEAGSVIFPLIGEKQVAGIPLRELRTALLEEYRIHLRNPSITITPLRRLNVLGEVNRPGPYEVDPTTNLIGVVALAAGPTTSGDLRRIRVLRDGRVVQDRVAAEASLSSLGIRSGDQIMVGPRSWLARNTPFVVSVLLAVPSVVYTITLIRQR
ncbi:MAG: polysaccharide biosynthesis/export family protein [Gemmatimonadetes bacterium]|nr:polysaccharide biosynthesis/export family protein [Gemmatimonadota bacterium]